jgi:protein-disulfide isomerase
VAQKYKKPANNKQFASLLIAIAVLGVAAIGYVLTSRSPNAGVTTVDPTIPVGKAEGYLIGKADAPLQVIEFADFECPACGDFANITEPDIRARLINTGMVAIRFYDYPLPMHKNTWSASNAVACANDQGRFLEMHDRVFAGQNEWNGEATSNPKKIFKQYVTQLGLDVTKWESCFDSQAHLSTIKGNAAEAARRNIAQTPTFIIGDKVIPGSITYDQFKKYTDDAIAEQAKTGVKPVASPELIKGVPK